MTGCSLWTLFAGATVFLALRLWVKVTRRHGQWYDDYILIVSWIVLLANNILIVYQFATGYELKDSTQKWDDRMHILINISSCGTLIGQAWSKTAFGVTLLRISNCWQRWILWFCIVTMNMYMVIKVIFQWAKVCDKSSYQNWYRLDFCINWDFRCNIQEDGNVYNIVMDFILATFPWLITQPLEMRRVKKIGLCLTMTDNLVNRIAIISAIRVAWKDKENSHDKDQILLSLYMQSLMSGACRYSSEIAGTIIVQCIPILRPILRDIHISLTSRKLGSTADGRSTIWISMLSRKQAPTGMNINNLNTKTANRIKLRETTEEPA
ncbi:hypothetical protein BKA56DRAFT_469408 [Ilyonectria sp. MPI-CAGE-AT-0026]|nr:hypothetical protein BKA56DRAFT_469408 [Ilyonectria sp. MPI-CAGE-AT-0026]